MFDAALMSSEHHYGNAPCTDELAENFLTRYNRQFHAQRADTPELVRNAQAIRYQVYCLERKFENAAEHGDSLESDSFDATAVHSLIFHRPSGNAIGTARLILPCHAAGGLPVQRLLREKGWNVEDHFPLETAAEISRFSISNQFRRRCSEGLSTGDARHERETCSVLPCLGLLQDLLRQSVALGLTHLAAVMEPKLLRMLAAMGFHTTAIGPLVFYHGLRQPCYWYLTEAVERLRREQPDHWVVVTNAGSLVPAEALRHLPAQRRAA
jgi:N-acyl amino acid synthase of PEP-CTERM/exosortase system